MIIKCVKTDLKRIKVRIKKLFAIINLTAKSLKAYTMNIY